MAISPKCDACDKELLEPGALLFSPPETVEERAPVMKFHVCVPCYEKLLQEFFVSREDRDKFEKALAGLVKRADEAGIESDWFDDSVQEYKSFDASAINNGGVESQLRYMLSEEAVRPDLLTFSVALIDKSIKEWEDDNKD